MFTSFDISICTSHKLPPNTHRFQLFLQIKWIQIKCSSNWKITKHCWYSFEVTSLENQNVFFSASFGFFHLLVVSHIRCWRCVLLFSTFRFHSTIFNSHFETNVYFLLFTFGCRCRCRWTVLTFNLCTKGEKKMQSNLQTSKMNNKKTQQRRQPNKK